MLKIVVFVLDDLYLGVLSIEKKNTVMVMALVLYYIMTILPEILSIE